LVTVQSAPVPRPPLKKSTKDRKWLGGLADSYEVHALLHQEHIKPVIQNRSLWKEQSEQMLPGHDGRSSIVYDEAGTVYCYDRLSVPMVRHRMAYIGYEPRRQTLKCRCPARHEGGVAPAASSAMRAILMGRRSASSEPSTCSVSPRSRGPRGGLSGSTWATGRWSG
jgi:hypothetical protein